MQPLAQDYLHLYHHSVKHAWRLEDLLAEGLQPDLKKPFMPDHVTHDLLARLLKPKQQRLLSQLRGCEYMAIIILIEDVIIDFFLSYLARKRYQSPFETQQTLTNFISEEMKHRLLFQNFLDQFHQACNFKPESGMRESLFLRFVLKHDDLGVMLFILHGEIMTYYNYAHSVKDAPDGIDPFFADILKRHWIEESSHIRIDELLLDQLIAEADPPAIAKGIQDYFWLLDFLGGALRTAIENDCQGLAQLDGPLEEPVKQKLWQLENHFYIETFILDVLRSKRMRKVLKKIDPQSLTILDGKIRDFEEAIRLPF